jgi:hypothetical protein
MEKFNNALNANKGFRTVSANDFKTDRFHQNHHHPDRTFVTNPNNKSPGIDNSPRKGILKKPGYAKHTQSSLNRVKTGNNGETPKRTFEDKKLNQMKKKKEMLKTPSKKRNFSQRSPSQQSRQNDRRSKDLPRQMTFGGKSKRRKRRGRKRRTKKKKKRKRKKKTRKRR